MSPEKDKALCKDFPHLFKDRNSSMSQTALCWGFPGNGWEPLIREAASKIEPIIVKMIDDAIKTNELDALDAIPTTSQVKEKFGTLCWYMTYGTEEIYDIIAEAEQKSAKICEICGKPGKLRGSGWVYTACLTHTKEQDRNDIEYPEGAYWENGNLIKCKKCKTSFDKTTYGADNIKAGKCTTCKGNKNPKIKKNKKHGKRTA